MGHFEGKKAIVTGGASGIGRALCEELGRQGAVLVVADIDAQKAEEVASAINKAGGRARSAQLDVSQAEAVQALVEQTAEEHGRLDFMFNNAGIDIGGELRDMGLDHWRRVIDVNQWGVIHGTHAAYPLMVKQGNGHIVNTGSLAALIPLPMETAYVASKWAVFGLSTSLRAEAADLGVKVSVVCPDFVASQFYKSSKHVNVDEERLLAQIPGFLYMTPQKCARKLLKGVRRNRAVITVGAVGRFLWRIYRYAPRLFILGQRIYARQLRRLRLPQ